MALLLLRWVLGLLLFYLAIFLHEDEEGRYQNHLQEWVEKLYKTQEIAFSWITVLMTGVARFTGHVFDRLFGDRLVSPRGVGVSICYAIASFFLSIALILHFGHPKAPVPSTFSLWASIAFFLLLGTIPAFLNRGENETLWIWGLTVFGVIVLPVCRIS